MTDQEAVIKVSEKLGYTVHSDYEFGPLVHYWVNDPHYGDIYYNYNSQILHRLIAIAICERQAATISFLDDGMVRLRGLGLIFTEKRQDIYMAIIRKYAEGDNGDK